jgi:IS1 family transposase
MRKAYTTSWLLFPPATVEVQLDEKWAFVGKKQKNCDPDDPADQQHGDCWDHTAVDAEHGLLLAIVPGKRTEEKCRAIVSEVKIRTGGRTDLLLTSDEHAPYKTAIKEIYGVEVIIPRKPGPGRPPKPQKVLPEKVCYATVKKTRKQGRIVEVIRALIFGTMALIAAYFSRSTVSSTINTSFVERHNGTDRGQNARKGRDTYCFSKKLDVHLAATYFVAYSYNFCWPVRTLRGRGKPDTGPTTPAMSAGLADHVWSLGEWVTLPVEHCEYA